MLSDELSGAGPFSISERDERRGGTEGFVCGRRELGWTRKGKEGEVTEFGMTERGDRSVCVGV